MPEETIILYFGQRLENLDREELIRAVTDAVRDAEYWRERCQSLRQELALYQRRAA